MSELMQRDETIKLFDELKSFVMDSLNRLEQNSKESASRIETKIDVATENINKYAKDTIEHAVKIDTIEKDVNSLGECHRKNEKDIRVLQRWHWVTSTGIAIVIFILNYIK